MATSHSKPRPATVLKKEVLDYVAALISHGEPIVAARTNAGKVITKFGYAIDLCPTGWPDITMCIDGKFVGIELKVGKDKQSDDQARVALEIAQAGGVYEIAENMDDFVRIVGRHLYRK